MAEWFKNLTLRLDQVGFERWSQRTGRDQDKIKALSHSVKEEAFGLGSNPEDDFSYISQRHEKITVISKSSYH